MQILNGAFKLASGGFVGLDGGFGFFETRLGAGQFRFDGRHGFGQGGYFIFKAADFFVRILYGYEVIYVRKHLG